MLKDLRGFKEEAVSIATKYGVAEIRPRRFEGSEKGAEGCWNPNDSSVIWVAEEYWESPDDTIWPIIVAHEIGHVIDWRQYHDKESDSYLRRPIDAERAADQYMIDLATQFGYEVEARSILLKHERTFIEWNAEWQRRHEAILANVAKP
jgi:hypothetical protein